MKICTNYTQSITVSMFLLAASQLHLVQAADYTYAGQTTQPSYITCSKNNTDAQSYGNVDYGSTDHPAPGYTQSYYGVRNYGRDSSVNPWSGSGPGFSGPWDSMRNGSTPVISSPWDSGRGGYSKPWSSGRGGSGSGFSGPWNSAGSNGYRKPW